MEQTPIVQNRHSERSSVMLSAMLEADGCSYPVRLRNLSKHGVLVEGETLPAEGAELYFARKELKVPSRVVWVHGHYAGIAFARTLEPEEILRHIPSARAVAVPEMKRPGLTCRPLSSYERRMLDSWMTNSPTGPGV